MRGLFFRNTGSLDNLQVEELPLPVLRAGEILVKGRAVAINPSDAKNVLGKMLETQTPRVPGRDFAGQVVSGGFPWEGKAVFGTGGDIGFGRDGSHAEFVAVRVEGWWPCRRILATSRQRRLPWGISPPLPASSARVR